MIAFSGSRERGAAGSILVAGICAGIFAVALAASLLIGWVGQARDAQHAAELAALAGVTAVLSGSDACSAAEEVADRNGATVSQCALRGTTPRVAVEVTASVKTGSTLPGVPVVIQRTATASPIG